ncbi:MAG TPA: tetratricopeptide repeat protein [Planctomycetota bacterium]|nr:tetratricopeptide repeat protein [Planctomycetota bacterium]
MSRTVLQLLAIFALGRLLASAAKAESDDDLALWVNEGKWARGPHAVELTPEKQELKAKKFESIGDSNQAAEAFKRLADEFSESDLAEEGLVLSARNYLRAGDFAKCRAQVDELHRRYVNPTFLDAMGEVEIALGRGFLDAKGEGGTYTLASRLRKARAIFQKQFDTDPQGRWADDALFGLGNCSEVAGDYTGAIKKYKEMLTKYPRSELRAEVESHIAFCINRRHPNPEYSETETEDARQRIAMARDEANMDNEELDKVALEENEKMLVERMAQKRFEQGMFYKINGHYRAAEVYFELVKERFPKTKSAPKAKQELDEMRKRGIDNSFWNKVFK